MVAKADSEHLANQGRAAGADGPMKNGARDLANPLK